MVSSRDVSICLALLGFASACAAGSASTAPAQPSPPPAPEPAAASATAPASAPAADTDIDIVIGTRVTLTSQVLGEERRYSVYLPASYASGTRSYPLMVLLDGDNHFHHATGIVEYLSQRGRAPEMIVVGVSNTDRTRDFTPYSDPGAPTSGGADRFLEFVERELLPHVGERYRVGRHRTLVGHSFGGLLAVHALSTKPSMFDAYLAISPSMQWANEAPLRRVEQALASQPPSGKFLYLTLGTENEAITRSNRDLVALLEAKAPADLRWKFTLFAEDDHGSVPHRSIYNGLELLFDGFKVPADVATLAAFRAHYEPLERRFGVGIPEEQLNRFGYRLLRGKPAKVDEAIAAFELNVELHPQSANVYDSLAEALEARGELARAVELYRTAVEKGRATNSRLLPAFEQNLARATRALEAGKGR